ncbi:hypothetical protein D3Y59_07725 [Hymenobacter oligotrophus]|uniref:Glycosyltransferase RgtA/B/C/D-like domain-containing protein n=1 Tax=Hymenobacter oligotrophus TaxID=2319843 RepID=A0A3B7RBX6_9BACT|nr:hypothetical protein [Hymenobacter oligotrophus]AYA36956.1 hypothetical protein D3Y59_07725 [Hymenobacter oligotrophus]
MIGLLAAGWLLGLFAYAYWPGPGTTSDSRYYISAARSFAAQGRLLNPDGSAYCWWGPLYPVLLAPGVGHLKNWVGVLNGLSLLGCLGAWSWLGWQVVPKRAVTVVFTLALACATPWLATAKFVWSEPVFGLLFGLYVVSLHQYLQHNGPRWLLAATVLGVLLPLQRTSGLFLLVGMGLGLLLAYPNAWKRRRPALLLHGAACGLAALAWLIYARIVAPYPEFYRNKGWQGMREALADYGYVLVRWMVPVHQAEWPKHWVFLVLLLGALAGLLYLGWQQSHRLVRQLSVAVVVYLLIHIATTVASRSAGNVYDVERYCAVVYGPVLLVLATVVCGVAARRRWVVWLLALWLVYPAARMIRVAHFCRMRPVQPLEAPHQTSRPAP